MSVRDACEEHGLLPSSGWARALVAFGTSLLLAKGLGPYFEEPAARAMLAVHARCRRKPAYLV